jgi:hypothetical protein
LFRNAHKPKHAPVARPADFFSSLRDRPAAGTTVIQQTPEQMLSMFCMITGAVLPDSNAIAA